MESNVEKEPLITDATVEDESVRGADPRTINLNVIGDVKTFAESLLEEQE